MGSYTGGEWERWGVWRWKRMGARKEVSKVTELKGQGGEKMMCVSVRSSYSKLIETLKNCVFVFGRSFLYGSFCGQEVCHCKSWREKHLWLSLCVLSLQPVTCDLRSLISGLFFNAHFLRLPHKHLFEPIIFKARNVKYNNFLCIFMDTAVTGSCRGCYIVCLWKNERRRVSTCLFYVNTVRCVHAT